MRTKRLIALAVGCAGVLVMASAAQASAATLSWGENEFGQLGIGTPAHPEKCETVRELEVTCSRKPVGVQVPSGTTLSAVSGGAGFSLGLTTEGNVLAWGREYSSVPTTLEGFKEKVTAISAGGSPEKKNFSLALLAGGTVEAWGENECGQLGNGTSGSYSGSPVEVQGLNQVVAVAAGLNFALAELKSGQVVSWGCNQSGQLGDGTSIGPEICEPGPEIKIPCSRKPVEVSGLKEAQSISAGEEFALARLANGTVEGWGNNLFGQTGNGESQFNTGHPVTTPVQTQGLTGPVTAIATGGAHGLALLSNGTVESWGDDVVGQLGYGFPVASYTAQPVPNLSGVKAVAAGGYDSLALLTNGTIEGWGTNAFGELGNGESGPDTCLGPGKNCALTPQKAVHVRGATAIAAGYAHTLAIVEK